MLRRTMPIDTTCLGSARKGSWTRAASSAAAAFVAVAGLVVLTTSLQRSDNVPTSQEVAATAFERVSLDIDARFLDPRPALAGAIPPLWPNTPLPTAFGRASAPAMLASAERPDATVAPAQAPVVAEVVRTVQIPLPVPRPAEFAPAAPRLVEGRGPRRSRSAKLAEPAPDSRSFFEKLFDLRSSPAPTVAYAALDAAPAAAPAVKISPVPVPTAAAGIAIYDITARTVTMPNGEKLEAHSGLGEKLDDPRFVHVRMKGATPPGTYDLTEREALFHGVRAIRLNPIGGSGAVHGRAGLLAHTYMLGPNGDSNGCVSFRDYERFLQAFLRGEVRQLVVVNGRGQDGPSFFNRQFGMGDRAARNG